MSASRERRPAKRVLDRAKQIPGKDIMVVARGFDGRTYVTSSLPIHCADDYDRQIQLLNEAMKKLVRAQNIRKRHERTQLREQLDTEE